MFLNKNALKVVDYRQEYMEVISQLMHFKSNIPGFTKVYEKNQKDFIQVLNNDRNQSRARIIKTASLNQLSRQIKGLPSLIYPMTLMYAVTYFDVFLSKTTFLLLKCFWPSLKTKTKTLTYDKILSFDSMAALKNNLIKKEVEVLGRQSIKERIEYLEKKYNLNFKYVDIGEPHGIFLNELVEIHLARNLVVHNNSIVNEIYLDTNSASKYKLGEKLKIDKNYLTKSLWTLSKACDEIANISVKKVDEDYKGS